MTIKAQKRTREQQRFWNEIRRSNASQPHKNKSKYSRKTKHKKLTTDNY